MPLQERQPHKFAKLDNSNFSFTILKVDCKTQNKNHEDSRSRVVSAKKKIAYDDDVLISRDLFYGYQIWVFQESKSAISI